VCRRIKIRRKEEKQSCGEREREKNIVI